MTMTLPDIGFLAHASDALRRMLADQATEVTLSRGDILFEQDDEGDAVFAILEGAVEFSILSMDGRKLSLDMMQPGAVFGEIALFDPGPRTATATAAGKTRLLKIRNSDVIAQIRENPELGIDLIRLAGQRMRWMGRQLNEQVFLPLPTRLACKLLHLLPNPERSELHLSQTELAEFVGATREAVSKTLSVWKRDGVVELVRGGLVVLDRGSLELLAEPDRF